MNSCSVILNSCGKICPWLLILLSVGAGGRGNPIPGFQTKERRENQLTLAAKPFYAKLLSSPCFYPPPLTFPSRDRKPVCFQFISWKTRNSRQCNPEQAVGCCVQAPAFRFFLPDWWLCHTQAGGAA